MSSCPKPKIYRNKDFLAFIRSRPCRCGKKAEPHHEDVLKAGGTAIKTHDYLTISLCRGCHIERHAQGSVYSTWNIDPKLEIIINLMDYIEATR